MEREGERESEPFRRARVFPTYYAQLPLTTVFQSKPFFPRARNSSVGAVSSQFEKNAALLPLTVRPVPLLISTLLISASFSLFLPLSPYSNPPPRLSHVQFPRRFVPLVIVGSLGSRLLASPSPVPLASSSSWAALCAPRRGRRKEP